MSAAASWFHESVSYQGKGRATFDSPAATVEGPATADFDDRGNATITLDVDVIACPTALRFGLWELVSGQVVPPGGSMGIGSPFARNPCSGLAITTSLGVFNARPVSYNPELTGFATGKLSFDIHRGQYDEGPASSVAYWVLPLLNYAERLLGPRPRPSHPLRLRSEGPHRTILFDYAGSPGFLEQLPDIDERRIELQESRAPRLLTGVLVGSLAGSAPTLDTFPSWPPLDLVTLLSVASGVRCVPAWIELRDPSGNLLTRIHSSWGSPVFHEGRRIIDETSNPQTGRLLTTSMASSRFGSDWLRVILKHLVALSRLEGASLEDHVGSCAQVFERILFQESIGPDDLTATLDQATKTSVTTALGAAARSIRANSVSDAAARAALARIADRVISAAGRENDLGLRIGQLAAKKGAHDFDIVNAYYQGHPRADGITTLQRVISRYRGTVVHNAFFDFTTKFDINDVYIVHQHLC